ncbi:3-deoxy-8-phosphooctulonate synthase [Planctomycetota bacterium]
MKKNNFKIGDGKGKDTLPPVSTPVDIGPNAPLFIMAGPCVIESEQLCLDIAQQLTEISVRTNIPIIFKASFDKANRTSIKSFRGPGIQKGLEILANIRQKFDIPVMTDIHEPHQADPAAKVVDCIQIPAFLSRQTDLLTACARTGKPINAKKGQFLSPAEMKNVVDKLRDSGNDEIMLTERGTFFGYNRLVNDMTAIEAMKQLGCPVIFDATHSTQQPGAFGNASAGQREMAPVLAKAAIAAGANGLFFEVHPNPEKAKCDAASMIPTDWLEDLITKCNQIFQIVNK